MADSEATSGGGADDDTVGDDAPVRMPRIPAARRSARRASRPPVSSSDKDFVSTALGGSRLWATVGHGIINEI